MKTYKHLMTGPKENWKFCFPETLIVPEGPVIKYFVIPHNSTFVSYKMFNFFLGSDLKAFRCGHYCEKIICMMPHWHKFAVVSRGTTWSCVSRKFKLLFPQGVSEFCSSLWVRLFRHMTRDKFSSNRKTHLSCEVSQCSMCPSDLV